MITRDEMASDLIEELEAEVARLRSVLEPFAMADFEHWMATEDCNVPEDAWWDARAEWLRGDVQQLTRFDPDT